MNMVQINSVNYKVIDLKNDSIWDYVTKIRAGDGVVLGYKVNENIAYFSERYGKWIGAEEGDRSDGATYAKDLNSFGWIFHDELCNDGVFEDGTVCKNWQASNVLTDIMSIEGYWFRSFTWFWGTWLVGGGEARDNGMI